MIVSSEDIQARIDADLAAGLAVIIGRDRNHQELPLITLTKCRDPIKAAFVAGFWAQSDAGPTLSVDKAFDEFVAHRLELTFDHEDELDEPIAYQLTPLGLGGTDRGMCFDEWLAKNTAG